MHTHAPPPMTDTNASPTYIPTLTDASTRIHAHPRLTNASLTHIPTLTDASTHTYTHQLLLLTHKYSHIHSCLVASQLLPCSRSQTKSTPLPQPSPPRQLPVSPSTEEMAVCPPWRPNAATNFWLPTCVSQSVISSDSLSHRSKWHLKGGFLIAEQRGKHSRCCSQVRLMGRWGEEDMKHFHL